MARFTFLSPRTLVVTALCASALLTNACTPVGIAAGAGAGVGIASAQEGGVSGAASDFGIRTQISDLWFRTNVDIFRKLNLTVDQGRVLITGVVQNPEHRVEAVRLAWQPKGVKQVINEIRVADSEGAQGYLSDKWITTQLRTKMTLNGDIQAINYSIDTVQGIVYLMGSARSREELNAAIETARGIKGVKQVISYVKMMGEPIRTVAPEGAAAPMVPSSSAASDAGSAGTMPAGAPGSVQTAPLGQ